MARKTLQTPDGKHVQFGETDTTKMPEDWFQPGGDAATCSEWFGDLFETIKGDSGFGSSVHTPHEQY